MEEITDGDKNLVYVLVISGPWVGNGSPRAPTFGYAGGPQSLFCDCDVARMLKGHLRELIAGNMGAAIPAYVRSDKSDAVRQVDSADTLTNGERPNGLREISRGL